jgi:hypothetical protein
VKRYGWLLLLPLAGAAQEPPAESVHSTSASQLTPGVKATTGSLVLRRHAINSGGSAALEGGDLTMGATLGQSTPGLATGGTLRLIAGFWSPGSAAPTGDAIFADGFEAP